MPSARPGPFGIALGVVLLLGLLFWAFICTQRGGVTTGEIGTPGPDAPEQLEEEQVR
ncbi:MAG: hypothetical protein R3181_12380 [Rubricoccaceae bacterium]|nr:hypothetical protein [Rubricoccaceae bacterium]